MILRAGAGARHPRRKRGIPAANGLSGGIALSASFSSPWRRGSWASWGFPRNRPRASRWSRCWAPPRCLPPPVGPARRPGRRADRRHGRGHRGFEGGRHSQDLKTGYLVGATPAKQQFGQLLGAAFACWAVAATLMLLGQSYGFGAKEIPAPQATLMKTIIEGVLSGNLPWRLVFSGGGIALCGILSGANGLAFAIGVYLPLSTHGPALRWRLRAGMVEHFRRGKPAERKRRRRSGRFAAWWPAKAWPACSSPDLWPAGCGAERSRQPCLFDGLCGQCGIAVVTLLICLFLWQRP